jgi:hypothetical protein
MELTEVSWCKVRGIMQVAITILQFSQMYPTVTADEKGHCCVKETNYPSLKLVVSFSISNTNMRGC